MNTISNGAQLQQLVEKCSDNNKELSQISISMNKELNHLSQQVKTQVETTDDKIMVKY